ncbi:MAG: site-2 protease family protein [bacterium]|nr:site-2 protease family protein [bacterium]
MSVILFLVILSVLVFVHELGHFLAAKRFGVRVDEFAIGFPPRLFKKKVGETLYSFNLIPFGGYVKIFGENPDEDPAAANGAKDPRSFSNIARWKQALILASGVIFNIVFAWALFSIAYLSGMTTSVSDNSSKYVIDKHVMVIEVLEGSPAARAGIMPGDSFIGIKSGSAATSVVATVEEVQSAVRSSDGSALGLEVLRNGAPLALTVTPEQVSSTSNFAIGIAMDLAGKVKLPIHLAIWEGGKLTVDMFVGIAANLYGLIRDAFMGEADLSQVAGPVGIARLVGDASSLGFIYLLSFTAFISMNLAVLNLIPFPALDGGRILFVAIEAISRRPIKPVVANTLNVLGFGLLILFMLFVTYKDIAKLI